LWRICLPCAATLLRRSQEGPVESRACTRGLAGERRGLEGEAKAALAEGREDGGKGAGDEGISFGIAYGSL